MSDSRNFVRNAVQNDSFGPDVLYAQGAYAAEGRPLFDYGMTATKEYNYAATFYGNGNFVVQSSYPDPSPFDMNVPQFDNDQDNAQPEHHDGFIDTGSFPVYASGPAPVDGYGHLNRPTNSQQDAGSDQDGNQPTGRNLDPKKGEVRDSAAGHWLEYKGPNSNEWFAAVRHDTIRDQLLQESDQLAAQYGGYDFQPAKGIDADDRTAFVPEHKTWGPARANRPAINFIFSKPKRALDAHIQPNSQPTQWVWHGYIVLDHEDNPMRLFDDCPTTLASCLEGFRLDAIQKRNPQIQTKDLLGRLPLEHTVRKASDNTTTVVPLTSGPGLTNVAMRWRFKAGILSWSSRANSDGTRRFLQEFLTAEQLRRNCTRGSRDLTKEEVSELGVYKRDYKRAHDAEQELPNPPRRILHMAAARGIPRHRRPNAASTSHADFQTAQSQQVDQQGLNSRSYGSGLNTTRPLGPPGLAVPSNHHDSNQMNDDQLGGAGDSAFPDDRSSSPLDIVNMGRNNRRKRRHAEVITLDDDESSPFQLQKPTPYHEDLQSVGPAPKKPRLVADPLPKSLPEKSHRHFSAHKSNSRERSKREGVRAGPAFSRPRKSGSRPSENRISSNPAKRAENHDSGLHQLDQKAETSGREIEVPPGFWPVFFPVDEEVTFFVTTGTEASFAVIEANDKTRWESVDLSAVIHYLHGKIAQQDDEPGIAHSYLDYEVASDEELRGVPYHVNIREGYEMVMFPVGVDIFCYSTKGRKAFAGQISPYHSTVWNPMSWENTARILESMEKRRLNSLRDTLNPQGSDFNAEVAPVQAPEEKVDGTSPKTPPTSFDYPEFHAPTAKTTPQEQHPPVLNRDELMLLWDEVDAANSQMIHTKRPEAGGHVPPSPNQAEAHRHPQPIISGGIYGHVDNSHGQAGRHDAEMPTILESSPRMTHHEIEEYSAEQLAQIEKEYLENTYAFGAQPEHELLAPPVLDIPGTHIHEVDHNESAEFTRGIELSSRTPSTFEELVAYNMARGLPPLPL